MLCLGGASTTGLLSRRLDPTDSRGGEPGWIVYCCIWQSGLSFGLITSDPNLAYKGRLRTTVGFWSNPTHPNHQTSKCFSFLLHSAELRKILATVTDYALNCTWDQTHHHYQSPTVCQVSLVLDFVRHVRATKNPSKSIKESVVQLTNFTQ